jgi:hypothetical protein
MQHNTNQAADDIYIYRSLEIPGVFTLSVCCPTLPQLFRGYYYKRPVASRVGFE